MKSILTKNQKRTIAIKNVNYQNEKVDLIINLRYDDEYGNGHNSFSITGSLYTAGLRSERATLCCGCIHDIIEELAPEYKKYIKWHLMDSDEPMHYISNTLYHARTKDCWGLEKGEVRQTKNKIMFNSLPITFDKDKAFISYLEKTGQNKTFEIEEIEHKEKETFSPKYTFKGFVTEWHKCPFDNIEEAKEWKKALKEHKFKIIEKAVSWGEGSGADLKSARNSAIAPNATLEQLQSEEWLKARLPKLKSNFKATMEELGFIY